MLVCAQPSSWFRQIPNPHSIGAEPIADIVVIFIGEARGAEFAQRSTRISVDRLSNPLPPALK